MDDALKKFIEIGAVDYSLFKICPQLLLKNMKQVEANLSRIKIATNPPIYPFPTLLAQGKKAHLWLYGPPSSGKTAIKLYKEREGCKISLGISNGWWSESLLDPECGTVWFDEIQKGQISIE